MNNLTDTEKVKIEAFCKDEGMFEAVKKGLLSVMYGEGIMDSGKVNVKNTAFNLIATKYAQGEAVSNEELGQRLRGLYEGVDALENSLAQLKKIDTSVKSPFVEINEAI